MTASPISRMLPGSLAEGQYAHQRPGQGHRGGVVGTAVLGSALEPPRERNGQGSLYTSGRVRPVEAPHVKQEDA